ncbi:hypothetical protein BJ508DRAFT_334924 [Ascobolus immersus RN42]|uniref:Uncharacterized protein n=1 Tax=Ascobolus immersus RN42 TaxID=1160509 RepID=A0A3N4HL09_ASCIM|nr:hypothetical protein BJ508DRAFT_334924 [Ascobolus immersus RN42]
MSTMKPGFNPVVGGQERRDKAMAVSASASASQNAGGPAPWSKLGGLIATGDLAPLVEEKPLFVKPPTRAVAVVLPTQPTNATNANNNRRPLTQMAATNRMERAGIQATTPGQPTINIPERMVEKRPAQSVPDISVTSPSCPSDAGKTKNKGHAVKVALALYREYVKRSQFGTFDLRMTWRDFIDPRPGSKAYTTIKQLKENGRFAGIRDDLLEEEEDEDEDTAMGGRRVPFGVVFMDLYVLQ